MGRIIHNDCVTLIFSAGRERKTHKKFVFGLDIAHVRGILERPKILPLKNAPQGVVGELQYCKKMVPVLSLAEFCKDIETDSCVVFIYEHKGQQIGFLGCALEQVLPIGWRQTALRPPEVNWQFDQFVAAVSEWGGGKSIMLLDVDKLIDVIFDKSLPTDIPQYQHQSDIHNQTVV